MTPGQARTALFGFALVMTGVAINALFLQSGVAFPGRTTVDRGAERVGAQRGPKGAEAVAPRRSSGQSSPEDPTFRIARFAADPGRIDPAPAGPDDTADQETIRAIQRELKLRGYGPIPVDGVVTLTTRAAIMAFEHDQGTTISGEASEKLLKRILLGVAASPVAAGGPGTTQQMTGHAEQVIRAVQQWLAALGYLPGRIDGRPGEETLKAIRDFEMDKGLVPRGRISAELVTRLTEAAEPRSPRR